MRMEYRRNADDTAHWRRTEKAIMEVFKEAPPEIFKWVAWASAIAALQVVDIRTGSAWLQWLAYFLSLVLVGRIQWFLYDQLKVTKHKEVTHDDGSSVTRFGLVRLLLGIPICYVVNLIAFGLPPVIARSDLLPTPRDEVTTRVSPASVAPSPVAPQAVQK